MCRWWHYKKNHLPQHKIWTLSKKSYAKSPQNLGGTCILIFFFIFSFSRSLFTWLALNLKNETNFLCFPKPHGSLPLSLSLSLVLCLSSAFDSPISLRFSICIGGLRFFSEPWKVLFFPWFPSFSHPRFPPSLSLRFSMLTLSLFLSLHFSIAFAQVHKCQGLRSILQVWQW